MNYDVDVKESMFQEIRGPSPEGKAVSASLAEINGQSAISAHEKRIAATKAWERRWPPPPTAISAMATATEYNRFVEKRHYGTDGKVTAEEQRGGHLFPIVLLICFMGVVLLHSSVRMCMGSISKAETETSQALLPATATQQSDSARAVAMRQLEAAVWISLWMACSAFFVIFNKWLFSKGGFPHPIFLTAFHMICCYVSFGALSMAPKSWTSSIMPDASTHITWDTYLKILIPIAVLYALSLGCGNLAFLYSSVAFLQMVKPINVVFTSIAAFIFMLETATWSHLIIVCIVACGVSLAVMADSQFSMAGLQLQLFATSCEALRLALMQKLMTAGTKLDPVTTVYRLAPLVGMCLAFAACFLEKPVDWSHLDNPLMLILNCIVATILNVLIVMVIKKASAVVFTLGGVTKDIATIAVSVSMFNSPITMRAIRGYGVSMVGILMFKVYKDNLAKFKEGGFTGGFSSALFGSKDACGGEGS